METKIKFTLEGYNVWGFKKPGFYDYKTQKERDFAMRERTGVLLEMTSKPFYKEDGSHEDFPCAIVKDDTDGNIYKINPENIQYYNN